MFLLIENLDGTYTLESLETDDQGSLGFLVLLLGLFFICPLLLAPVAFSSTLACWSIALMFGVLGKIRGISWLRYFSIPFVNYGVICSLFATYSRTDSMDPVSMLSVIGLPLVLFILTSVTYYAFFGESLALVLAVFLAVQSCVAYMLREDDPMLLDLTMRLSWILAAVHALIRAISELHSKTMREELLPWPSVRFNFLLAAGGFGLLLIARVLTAFVPSWLGALLTALVYGAASFAVVMVLMYGKKKFTGSPAALLIPLLVGIFYYVLPHVILPLEKGVVPGVLRGLASLPGVQSAFNDFNAGFVFVFQELFQKAITGSLGLLGGLLGMDLSVSPVIPGFVVYCLAFLLLRIVIALFAGAARKG